MSILEKKRKNAKKKKNKDKIEKLTNSIFLKNEEKFKKWKSKKRKTKTRKTRKEWVLPETG